MTSANLRARGAIAVLMVLGLGLVPRTLGLVTAQTADAQNTFSSTAVYSPTGLAGSWNGRGVVLTWSAPVKNRGNGYIVTALNNVGNSTCPTTSAAYGTYVGSTASLTYTDSASRLVTYGVGDYLCYMVRSAYNPAGAPPWASAPAWASGDTFPTVAVRLTITHVQSVCTMSNGTTLTATFPNAVVAGDLLVGVFRAGAPVAVSDNVNGAWSAANGAAIVDVYYLANSAGAAANALTVTLTGASGALRICVDEFAGVATKNPLDQSTAAQSGANAAWQAPATPPTAGGQLVYTGAGSATNSATFTAGTTNGVAMTMAGQLTSTTLGTVGAEYALGSTAGAQNSTLTLTPSPSTYSGVQVTFWPRAIMRVQSTCAIGSGTSLTNKYLAAVAAGDLLVGVFTGAAPLAVSDSVNGAWTLVNSSGTTSLFYRENTRAAAANAMVITLTGASGSLLMCTSEFAGTLVTGSLDRSSAGTSAASPWQAPATAANPAGELVYAGVSSAANNVTLAAGTTDGVQMTLGASATSAANGTIGAESVLSSATGAQNSTMTLTPSAASTGVQAMFLAGCTGGTICGTFGEYAPATSGRTPMRLSAGPDDAVWFTEETGNKVGRSTTAGVISNEYAVPTAGSQPSGITTGADGALWFTETSGNKIGRITTGGTITEYAIPTAGSQPKDIVAGADGALWFAENAGNKIGRITTVGSVSEYAIPTAGSNPYGITAGPDGALWFTEMGTSKIGRITTGGTVTEYATLTAASQPHAIDSGSDGALWFAEFATNKIGRVTTSGTVTEYTVPTAASSPYGITAGSDGALWFGENATNQIGRLTTGGVFTEFAIPTANSQPKGMETGPDGAVWFAEYNGNKLGRLS